VHLSGKEIAVTTDITHRLPKVVADHIAACNAHDIETWMATFAPDALLNDISREFMALRRSARSAPKKSSGTM
jgi:ketosteroid isomerase-like protein